jgi:hypothetical protein
MIAHAGLPLGECADQLRVFASSPTSVNLLPPERNRGVMDHDELIAAMVSGDDTALWAAPRAGAGTSPA